MRPFPLWVGDSVEAAGTCYDGSRGSRILRTSEVLRAWNKILKGEQPSLSIEITRECPLKCPGCYAYDDAHLGGGKTLRDLNDRKGQSLVDGVLKVVDRLKPLHLSIVGGDPLVRYRELEFLEFWTPRPEVKKVWFSLFTPQVGDQMPEILGSEERARAIADMVQLRKQYPKLDMPEAVIRQFASPPQRPQDCVFALTTQTLSADLETKITPCQFGGNPDCASFGCIASIGFASIA